MLAAVLGALVVHGIIGKQPSFSLKGANAPSWIGYVLTPLVAALASVVGVYFQRVSLDLRERMKTIRRGRWALPIAGALVAWALGVAVFWRTGRLGVFSLGYDDLSSALAGDVGWQLATVFLLTKFLATCACYGFGGCGGIFSPTLFFGGMVGAAVAGVVNLEWTVSRADALTLAVVGMSACLGAVVWAPVTGILIVFEMTHEFSLVPALMLGALVSQSISRNMNRENFYEAILTQDGHRIEHVRPPRDLQGWQQLPVSAIANFKAVILHSLERNEIELILNQHPYERFPVVVDGKLAGTLSRKESEAALAQGRSPNLDQATTCTPNQTIRELQMLLIESAAQMVVMTNGTNGEPIALVTLHDLLRAQVQKASEAGD
jgi:CIC family chloride channel protein